MLAYPMRTQPCYKTMPWGGTGLNAGYGKASPYEKTGESWEAASHPNGSTPIQNGPYAGMTPGELAKRFGNAFLGRLAQDETFPVLFKLIDARENLSLQVHPDDAYAQKDGDNGKTEMWIVLQAEEGAGLYLGFETPVTKAEFANLITENRLHTALHYIKAQAGDVFFLPAGLVHAIGTGLLIAEIQQSSDATYRVYDWGRFGPDGKGRPLHIEKALDVSDTAAKGCKAPSLAIAKPEATVTFLQGCPLFAARRLTITERFAGETRGDSFHILFCAEGAATIAAGVGAVGVAKGDTVIVPACAENYTVTGKAEILCFYLPDFDNDYTLPLRKAGYAPLEINKLFAGKPERMNDQ